MSEWFHELLSRMVERGEMRIDEAGGYWHTAKGAEKAREALRRTEGWDRAMEQTEKRIA